MMKTDEPRKFLHGSKLSNTDVRRLTHPQNSNTDLAPNCRHPCFLMDVGILKIHSIRPGMSKILVLLGVSLLLASCRLPLIFW